jgi:UDP-N-acetylmuramoyl-tripeptide--D-alanyl-D-alanine ligase
MCGIGQRLGVISRAVRWTPESLAAQSGGRLRRCAPRPIAGVFIDSREAVPGALFVPIVAARDGHDFVSAAISAGASAILQHPGRPLPDADVTVVEVPDTLEALTRLARHARGDIQGPVVAITGSNGKTTTRAMIAAILGTGYRNVLSTRGNLNNHLGVPLTLLGEPHDPSAATVELGMNAPGENHRLAAIVEPTVGVITSVALEHLEFLGSLDAVARAEAEIIPHVREDGALVLPGDEPLLCAQIPHRYRPTVSRFGESADAVVRIENTQVGERTLARLRVPGGERVDVSLRAFGAHNARNAAAALAVGFHLGLPLRPMIAALENVEPVGDRGRTVRVGRHLVIADCYNANPGSVEAALRSLAALRASTAGPLIAVLGDMLELGHQEHRLHADMGRLAAELDLDLLVTLGSRSASTAAAARRHGARAEHFGDDIEAAAQRVRASLSERSGAVLVKASRGMRLERVVDALARTACAT